MPWIDLAGGAIVTIRDYQHHAAELLQQRFGVEVSVEWAALSGEPTVYSPRLDVAVGPFAAERRCHDEYDLLQAENRRVLERLYAAHQSNLLADGQTVVGLDQALTLNFNARCFMAIEIENQVSRKHLMGGAINASALGRLGIAIGWTPVALRCFVRLNRYLAFLTSVGKNSFDTSNLLVLSPEQFTAAIRASGQRRRRAST